MKPDSRIYVAGHRGLAGSALVRRLKAAGFRNLVLYTHAELDLTEQVAVRRFFAKERPECVLLAAAKVGGILANYTYPAEFIQANLAIQTNVIHEAFKAGVKRLLFLGSSCVYPRDCPQPIKEQYLLTGPLEPSNRPYALAKIAGIEMCWSYNRQYGTRYLVVMPTNLYGPGDNFDLQNSHVLPALIRKILEANERGEAAVTIWGTGMPRREFLYSEDFADACLHLLLLPETKFDALVTPEHLPLVNIGVGADITIRELAHLAADIVGFRGELSFDATKPDGTPRKLLEVSRMQGLGWRHSTSLREGIEKTCSAYLISRQGANGR